MADTPEPKNLLPSLVQQNPAPFTANSQARMNAIRSQVDRIMNAFYKLVPSNYAAQIQGPYYTIQFQALAERIADFQITAQEVMADSMYDYTRTEVLYQILGSLIFPDANTTGYPDLEGDLTYRTFLQRMVTLLLQGATKETVKSGVELLTTATVEVIERGVEARKLKGASAWGPADQFTFEVNVSNDDAFPDEDPFVLQRNVDIVLRALKPAHTLYEYRHLFQETFGPLFTESVSYGITDYKYQDLRRYWLGADKITGSTGVTLTDKTLFADPTRDFNNINIGAVLSILSGPNSIGPDASAQTPDGREELYPGRYRVIEILGFPIPTDTTARAYTTSGGLSGTATVSNGYTVTDTVQNWGLASEGDTITFLAGPNAGTYRLKTVLGSSGGDLGVATGLSGTQVRIAPCLLRVQPRMAEATTGQRYEVDVDRLGVQVPHPVYGEDHTIWFLR